MQIGLSITEAMNAITDQSVHAQSVVILLTVLQPRETFRIMLSSEDPDTRGMPRRGDEI